jgi:hypothetical protein
MRSILVFLRFVVIGLAFAGLSASAGGPIKIKPIPSFGGGGLSVSLTTGGYRFAEAINGPVIQIFPPIPGGATSFAASVAVCNRSRLPITFNFNDAGPRWTFRILDSDDQEVWQSDSDIVSAQVITEDVLGPGKTWKRTERIPLIVDESPLAPGIYTLQAFLNADKSVSATSVFEIVPREGEDTGIKGLVLSRNITVSTDTNTPPVPVPGALVTVTEIVNPAVRMSRPPFNWNGSTDSEGRFVVKAPPGHYRVTATRNITAPHFDPISGFWIGFPGFTSATAEVNVQQGAFSAVTLYFDTFTVPTITQGIKGFVSYPSPPVPVGDFATITTITTNPDLIRFGSFSVSVVQVNTAPGETPFTWHGFTDFLGRFQVATPTGEFRVTATGGAIATTNSIPPSIMAPTAFANVTVPPNTVATVIMTLSPGCVVVLGPQ